MRKNMFLMLVLVMALIGAGCGPSDEGSSGNGSVQGSCQYDDAQTNTDGTAKEPAQPEPQPMTVEVHMSGTGTFPNLAQSCSVNGNFSGMMQNNVSVDDDGRYLSVMNFGQGAFSTELGCQIPELNLATVLSFKVVAKLENTQRNCKTYCDAKLSASCESSCESQFGGASARATCRQACEAQGSGSCQTHCTGSTTRRITAETQLSAAAIAELNARRAGVNGVGEMNIDLTFDKVTE